MWPASWFRKRREKWIKTAVQSAFEAGFIAAEKNRRTSGWLTPSTGPHGELDGTLATMRARSQDLVKNNPHGVKAHEVFVGMVCDTGLTLRSLTGDPGLDDEVESAFGRWTSYAGAGAIPNFYALQAEATGGWFDRGGAIGVMRTRPVSWGLEVPFQIQLLEDDYLDDYKTEDLGRGYRVTQGVEQDARDRIVRYWLYREHPHESRLNFGLSMATSAPVRADMVVYLYHPLRIGQLRGVPWLHPVILHARDYDDYRDAERVRKKIEACLTGIVTGGEPSEDDSDPAEGTPRGIANRVTDAYGNIVEQFRPGLIAYAPDGREIKINAPVSVGGFAEFSDVELHTWAAGARLPYEELTGDFSKTTFHGFKAGRIPLNRMVRRLQGHDLVARFVDPIFARWLDVAVAVGVLPARVQGYQRAWVPRPPDEIDRKADAEADAAEMANGTLTHWEAVARRGKNPIKHLAEEKRYRDAAAEQGIAVE